MPPSSMSVLLPRPPRIETEPPFWPASRVSPALRIKLPPSTVSSPYPFVERPTARVMEPALPCSASPVRMDTSPESPYFAPPVLTNTFPLTPRSPECSVPIRTLPLEVRSLAPERSSIVPPYDVDALPGVKSKSPPVSLYIFAPSPAPPSIMTDPPSPPSESSRLAPRPAVIETIPPTFVLSCVSPATSRMSPPSVSNGSVL